MLTALLLAAAVSPTPFDQVVAAERRFAAAGRRTALHEAFLANLTDDAIAFNPMPTPARPLHVDQPPPKGDLQWGPGWVAVSAAGDLAVSTGPWEIRLNSPTILKDPQTQGWFISMWRRQGDGGWKVAVDAGVSSPTKYVLPATVADGTTPPKSAGNAEGAKLAIAAAEQAFAVAAMQGIGGAVEAVADPALRVYREGKPAAFGAKESKTALATDGRKAACAPEQVISSKSGDLAYSYGACTATDDATAKYAFLHVWRRQPDQSWRILVDVTP